MSIFSGFSPIKDCSEKPDPQGNTYQKGRQAQKTKAITPEIISQKFFRTFAKI